LVQNVKKFEHNFWMVYSESAKLAKPSQQKKDFYRISTDNAQGVGIQFVPEIKSTTAIRNQKSLSMANLTNLLQYNFITDYRQNHFNPNYLFQAESMRVQMKQIIRNIP